MEAVVEMATISGNSAQTVITVTSGMTATGNSTDTVYSPTRVVAAQASVVGSGAVSATVNLQASLDGTNWVTIKAMNLAGTTSDSELFLLDATFQFYRVNVSAISGTSATVSAYIKT